MIVRKITTLILALAIATAAFAEQLNQVVIGAFYFESGFFSDEKVKVIDVNYSSQKVKIYRTNSGEIDWISPSSLITRSESDGRDINRLGVGLAILGAIIESADDSTQWRPGSAHPSFSNVVAAENSDTWRPKPGYEWVTPNTLGRVYWKARLYHPSKKNVVSSDEVDNWTPAPGYRWVNYSTSWDVVWRAEVNHPWYPNVVSVDAENTWKPAPGYEWVTKNTFGPVKRTNGI